METGVPVVATKLIPPAPPEDFLARPRLMETLRTAVTRRVTVVRAAAGYGKTTLLDILAFLEKPAGGTMTFCGEPVEPSARRLLQLRRQVVLVDQHPIMFSTTVGANIEFGLKIRKVDPTVRRRKVDEALETVGLSRYKSAAARELSGGETQRLALANAEIMQKLHVQNRAQLLTLAACMDIGTKVQD